MTLESKKQQTTDAIEILRKNRVKIPDLDEKVQEELGKLRLFQLFLEMREKSDLTQTELAALMGLKQSTISRIENGDYHGLTISTLLKAAKAMRFKIKIEVEPFGKEVA